MPNKESAGLRARIPAAIAAATAATVQQAHRLLDKASQVVPLRRAKAPDQRPTAPPPGGAAPGNRDDTH